TIPSTTRCPCTTLFRSIVRFMALRTPGEAKVARRIGVGWMLVSTIGAVLTALIGIAYFADEPLDKASSETVFLLLSQVFFHPLRSEEHTSELQSREKLV